MYPPRSSNFAPSMQIIYKGKIKRKKLAQVISD